MEYRALKEYGQQLDIFSCSFPSFRFTKPVRLIELFGGYGSQSLAFRYLGIPFENWKLCEWNYKSYHAYRVLNISDDKDYSVGKSKEEMSEYLLRLGVSADWNKPMTVDQIRHMKGSDLSNAYSDVIATHNLVDITKVHSSDLEIRDTDKFDYVMTYSFPCQDLSLAGKRAGMVKGSGTRSGLLWEVERILSECKVRPQVLLMENVPQVHSDVASFNAWLNRLEELGYKNYVSDLVATDYGIPQVRDRCYMVSILGDYSYLFPQPQPLKLRLKDMLEKSVDSKYLLSRKAIEYILSDKGGSFNSHPVLDREVAATLHADNSIQRAQTDNFFTIPVKGASLPIVDATKKGYDEARDGDGVYISNIHGKRGTVQHGKAQTLKTSPDVGVVCCIDKSCNDSRVVDVANCITTREDRGVSNHRGEGTAIVLGSYTPSGPAGKILSPEGCALTVTTGNHGTQDGVALQSVSGDKRVQEIIDSHRFEIGEIKGLDFYNKGVHSDVSSTITLPNHNNEGVFDGFLIRKFTPREEFRLMGLRDDDISRLLPEFSDSVLFHLAGDSIVVNVLMAIFGQMWGKNQ